MRTIRATGYDASWSGPRVPRPSRSVDCQRSEIAARRRRRCLVDPIALFLLLSAPAVGSFAGLAADRFGTGRSLIRGGSRCDGCGARLAVVELIPIVSWLWAAVARRGRSRCCDAPIPTRHIATELVALGVAIWAISTTDGVVAYASVGLGWTLLALSAIDLKSFRLPDLGTLSLVVAGLALAALDLTGPLLAHAAAAALGYGALALVGALYRRYRGVDGLGLGDAKLLAAAGAWVGPNGLASTLLWGCLFGLATAALLAALNQRRDRSPPEKNAVGWRMAIPFGPALSLGFWITWLYGPIALT